jgi:hypothetical protein
VGPRDPEAVPVQATVVATVDALLALPAGQRRIHDHTVTDGDRRDLAADRHHGAADLVAGDQWVLGPCVVALVDVDVGSADTDPGHLDHDVGAAGGRIVDLLHGQLPGRLEHHSTHLTYLSSGSKDGQRD